MEIKQLKSEFVYFKQIQTTLKEIGNFVGNTPAVVAEEAIKNGFKIVGPQIWDYSGADGNPDTKFTVDICFQVEEKHGINNPNTKYLKGFKSASYVLKGPWSSLGNAYSTLIAEMEAGGLKPSDACREVYHLCDFEDQNNCITEIQLGIQ
jgi:effector-binding domain-containing protein